MKVNIISYWQKLLTQISKSYSKSFYAILTDFTGLLMSPTTEYREKDTSSSSESYGDNKIFANMLDSKATVRSEAFVKSEYCDQKAENYNSSKFFFENEATSLNDMPIEQNSMKQEDFVFETMCNRNVINLHSKVDQLKEKVEVQSFILKCRNLFD